MLKNDMIERVIKLVDQPDHINDFLTHWTGRNKTEDEAFGILEKIIISRQLKFSCCVTSFPESRLQISNEMICFTDTPIMQSKKHCERYNYFGISFDKPSMINYGANPVLYLVDNRKAYSEFFNMFYL